MEEDIGDTLEARKALRALTETLERAQSLETRMVAVLCVLSDLCRGYSGYSLGKLWKGWGSKEFANDAAVRRQDGWTYVSREPAHTGPKAAEQSYSSAYQLFGEAVSAKEKALLAHHPKVLSLLDALEALVRRLLAMGFAFATPNDLLSDGNPDPTIGGPARAAVMAAEMELGLEESGKGRAALIIGSVHIPAVFNSLKQARDLADTVAAVAKDLVVSAKLP